MKQYDRQTKRWISVEEYEKRYNKRDSDLCRGKKPHDFVLVLPSHVKYNDSYAFNAEAYYRLMDEKYELLQVIKEKAKAIGVEDYTWNRRGTRLFICSVCKKHKYDLK